MKMERIVLFFIVAGMVLAFPQLPVGYYGSAMDQNGNPMSGSTIEVRDGSGTILTSIICDDNGEYTLVVPWDDPETGDKEGVVADDTLYFYVDGERAHTTIVPEQGSDNMLELSVSMPSSSSSGSSSGSGGGFISDDNETDSPVEDQEAQASATQETLEEISEGKTGNESEQTIEDEIKPDEASHGESEKEGVTIDKPEEEESGTIFIYTLLGITLFGMIIYIIIKKRGAKK